MACSAAASPAPASRCRVRGVDGRGLGTSQEIARAAALAGEHGRFGIDTEFMSEGRYRALLCLVQIVVDDPDAETGTQIVLIDPLDEPDLGELPALLADPSDRGDHARRPSGRRDPPAGVAHRGDQPLRHADLRRLRRRQRAVGVRQPARVGARRAGGQDRLLHPLGRPPAERRAAPLRRRGRRPSAPAHRRAPGAAADERAPRVGPGGVPPARGRHRRARSLDGVGATAAGQRARSAGARGRARARRLARADRLGRGSPGRVGARRRAAGRAGQAPAGRHQGPRADPRHPPPDDPPPRRADPGGDPRRVRRPSRSRARRSAGARSPATRR